MSLPPGARLGRYQILSLLGAGGMGVVYRARDERLQRDVAIKVLPPSVLADETARRRFTREAHALAKLSHPNIAAIYDVGEEAEMAYLVMELVPGESLAARLERDVLPLAEAMTVTIQIANALTEAHEQGVVHRDLKPANVMITPKGQLKVLDFGLAKLLTPVGGETATLSRSELGAPAGTPLYMSPEQAFGEKVDARTDLWSLGIMIFESLSGKAPFTGATDWALLKAVSQEAPASLSGLRPELPPSVEAMVTRALSKDPATRYQTAAEVGTDATAILARISGPVMMEHSKAATLRSRAFVPLLVAVLVVFGVVGWLTVRASHRNWARTQALPEINRLIDADLTLAANHLLARAVAYLPGDTAIARLTATSTRSVTVTSSPEGAVIAIQDYLTPDSAWTTLGTTPIRGVTIPKGYFRWRATPLHGAALIVAPPTRDSLAFKLDAIAPTPGMVRVPAGTFYDYSAFIGWVGPYRMPSFDIDRYEVTNREFQQFVDSGGYRNRALWHEKFIDNGTEVGWDDAMARFRDRSGRPGPSTWTGGHFPEGEGDYPVSGVSWYEASAYAAFKGQELPSMAAWHRAAPPDVASFVGRASNMNGTHLAAVGTYKGVGPYGTYDMAGNVREWVLNANQVGGRLILGGAWTSAFYLYADPEMLPPFDRSPTNGFRCVKTLGEVPPGALAAISPIARDFSTYTPATDAVFNAYQPMFAYDRTPLNAKVEGTIQTTADWRVEKVTFDAAYNGERLAAYLYIPAHVKPPYQTVIFFPSARILSLRDSKDLGDVEFFDYIVQSGRAVFYPVYQDTYERRIRNSRPGPSQNRDVTTERAKDLGRALDYLATRPDVDTARLAYVGVSMGAAEGVIYSTLQQARLKTTILLDGGFFLNPPTPGIDPADFAPRFKKPVLMVNGRYDATFSLDKAQLPLLHALGTPAADKEHVILEASHDVTAERPRLTQAVVGWLDRYLGRVE